MPRTQKKVLQPVEKNAASNLDVLKKVQTINKQINDFLKTQPQMPDPWFKRKTMVNKEKMTKANGLKLAKMYEQLIKLTGTIERASKTIKKGDVVFYLNDESNKILEAKVVSIGEYVSDYNDMSGFIRIKNNRHSWDQLDDSLIKK